MAQTKNRSAAKMAQGAARKAHFAQGGTVAQWKGRAATFQDRKKQQSRTACRGQVAY